MPKVRVSAIPEKGFGRIGKRFSREATEHEVTAKELDILKKEKMLVVVEIPAEKKEKEKEKEK
jgi:hypothetical protein